jgi:hypothetical protein
MCVHAHAAADIPPLADVPHWCAPLNCDAPLQDVGAWLPATDGCPNPGSVSRSCSSTSLGCAGHDDASTGTESRIGRARLRMVLPQVRAVLMNRCNHSALLILAGLAGSYWAFVGLWALPLLLTKDIPMHTAVLNISGMMACYAVGAPIFGWIGDRFRRHAMTLSAACAGAVVCWTVIASGVTLSPAPLALVLFALGFFSSGFHLAFAIITERNPIEHAGTSTSYINIGTFLGAAVTQTIGAVSGGGDVTSACVLPMAIASLVALVTSAKLWPRRAPSLASALPATR